jgi:hypothetical protein
MWRSIRRGVGVLHARPASTLGVVLVVAMPVALSVLAPAGAASAGPPAGRRVAPAAATVIDGMSVRHLPDGLGSASDFVYDYDDVDFVARVWESQPSSGGWRVDLDIDVMRGARLRSGRALHDWFIAYEERDPTPSYRPVRVHGHPGWLCPDQIFWLVRPGVAVSVQLDTTRWSRHELMRIARSTSGR